VHGQLVEREVVELDNGRPKHIDNRGVVLRVSKPASHAVEKGVKIAPRQIILGLEIPEERAPANPRLFRNLIDSCLFESSLNEELQRDLAEVTVGRGVHSPGARGHGLHCVHLAALPDAVLLTLFHFFIFGTECH
jgi:hypothetical protein